jgi:hypothetical protein
VLTGEARSMPCENNGALPAGGRAPLLHVEFSRD